ncbi:DUF3883 domain-containing protein [Brevibacillus sp. GCM10020057]|uniref:DUF3883 domain-containing protein n=1 Tax=Brevibacillus sp. GCM10020057 TaxID=3317327 RepID=UPI0036283118
MAKIFSLFDLLPVYYATIENNSGNPIQPQTSDYENSNEKMLRNYEWWKVAEEFGKEGEATVLNYLSKQYNSVEKVKDAEGYDFKVVDLANVTLRIEVKTVQSFDSAVYITRNELNKANQYKSSYYIYLLVVNRNEKYADLFIVQNPIDFFEINMVFVNEVFKNKYINFENKAFRIEFNKSFFASETVVKTHVKLPFLF